MNKMKRAVAIVLAIATLFCCSAVSAYAADWRTGNFGGGYTTVRLSNIKQDGYIRIHTYNCVLGNHTGKCYGTGETNAKLHITFRNASGGYITEFNTTSKTKLKLGKGRSAYRVYIACRQDLGKAANWINLGNCTHWGIETGSNTHF